MAAFWLVINFFINALQHKCWKSQPVIIRCVWKVREEKKSGPEPAAIQFMLSHTQSKITGNLLKKILGTPVAFHTNHNACTCMHLCVIVDCYPGINMSRSLMLCQKLPEH